MTTIKGIDISHWNRVFNFQVVKDSGIDFVIIKAGGSDKGFYTDRCFNDYYRLAKLAGLHVGAYYFVGKNFISALDGQEDAKRLYRIIQGKTFDYPIYLDLETTAPENKEGATEASIAFCEYLESKGYYVGIYASDISGFKERLDIDKLEAFDKWVARYGKRPEYVKKYGIWQKSSKGEVSGIFGNVDIDISSRDYPSIIMKNHLNGWR
ncbi:MAG: hypothetical protein J6S67_13145 [Methanobrevibacter sp.]|nr:hypothetical protein [Methanobrevibacter sp.]